MSAATDLYRDSVREETEEALLRLRATALPYGLREEQRTQWAVCFCTDHQHDDRDVLERAEEPQWHTTKAEAVHDWHMTVGPRHLATRRQLLHTSRPVLEDL